MQLALTAGQMKNVDLYMMQTMGIPNIVLMENAAMGVYEAVKSRKEPCAVHVYCGVGNNGGDGLAAARILLANGYDVYVIIAGEPDRMTPDTLTNFSVFKELKSRAKCIKHISDLNDYNIPPADIVIDALLGTGLTRPVEGLFADLINEINSYEDALIVSVDVPSGIQADTGVVLESAVRADITVTFQHPKVGLYLYPGKAYVGELKIAKIGIDEGCEELRRIKIGVYDCDEPDLWIRKRRPDANKGDFGRLLLIAGSQGMAGAAVMACKGASRAGAGLVTLAAPKDVVNTAQISVPQATCATLPEDNGRISQKAIFDIAKLIKGKSALAIGPGLGESGEIKELVENLLCDYDLPKVFDADALNALKGNQKIFNHKIGGVIITPHPAEFARILNRDISDVLSEPITLAAEFAKQYQVIVVLKGATTIIADPKGNARLVCGGTPGMAKGGSGDVLTGIIAGLAAQGKSILESALLGTIIAAAAGERAARRLGEYSMNPLDELDEIGEVMKKMESDAPPILHERNKMPTHPQKHVKETQREVKETPIPENKTREIIETKVTEEVKASPVRKKEVSENIENEKPETDERIIRAEERKRIKERKREERAHEVIREKRVEEKERVILDSEPIEETAENNIVEEPSAEEETVVVKEETHKILHGGKTAEQALAEIKAKEESEMRRNLNGANSDNALNKTTELKKEVITEIIDMEENPDNEPTPPKRPTPPTRRRIG